LSVAMRRVRAQDFGAERRASVRFPVNVVARLDAMPCYLTDLSLTGARVIVANASVLDRGLLTFYLDGTRFQLPVAIRSRATQADDVLALGVAFDGVAAADRARLALGLFGGVTMSVELDAVASDAA
jgi:hypothetical protein